MPTRSLHRVRLIAIGLLISAISATTARAQAVVRPEPPLAKRVEDRPKVPGKVEPVLRTIDETGKAPTGHLGGRAYENQGRRGEQVLPKVDREGDPIAYQSWDVNPEKVGSGRGAERIVTGSDGSAYYTPDDYKTFLTIRNPARSHHGVPDHAATVPAPPPPAREMPREEKGRPPSGRNAPAKAADKPVVTLDPKTAARVMPVVDYILAHDAPPPDAVGGREYRNLGLDNGEVLPRTDASGRPIRYREWDVNKKVPGRNRGAERIVTGSDGRVYYTNDHYATFQRIR
jgi:guanyl-specific ribonuclease Sa